MQPLSRGSGLRKLGAHPAGYLQTKARRPVLTSLTLASGAALGLGEDAAPNAGDETRLQAPATLGRSLKPAAARIIFSLSKGRIGIKGFRLVWEAQLCSTLAV